MLMPITPNLISALSPAAASRAVVISSALNDGMAQFGIDTPIRQAMFLAQAAHESQSFTRLEENLNYGQAALLSLFGRYFPDADTAHDYARQPERIANRIYANRMGNGDEASGDGWKHRGAGAIQLTGTNNHRAYSIARFGDERLVDDPSPLHSAPEAFMSSAWFWMENGLNRYADIGDFDGVSDVVNLGHKTAAIGDSIGYQDRLNFFIRAKHLLGVA